MRATLFRPEALEGKADARFGSVLFSPTPTVRCFAIAATLSALCIVAFLFFGQYTRKVPVVGVLMPDSGLIKVSTPLAGTVVEQHASEGRSVRRGDRLMVVSTDRASPAERESQAAALTAIRQRRDSLKR